MTLWLSLLVVAGVSLVLIGAMRHFAPACSLAGLPNARSPQSILTCDEGEIAIAFGFHASCPLSVWSGLRLGPWSW
jgi:hypothetical protein